MRTEEEKTERADAEEIVAIFDGRFREQYGEGHLLMACHAAFPIAVTPDMFYQLWANFREYTDGTTGQPPLTIDRIAVSDVLLWHCWQETDPEVYELDAAVRACLLDKLRTDTRFGEKRIQELAQFLHQYTERIIGDRHGPNFREAQQWTVMATLAPAKATEILAQRLTQSVNDKNEPEVLRLRNVLEALTSQEERFRGMLYVSKALKANYLGYDSDTISRQIKLAKGQRGYGLTTDIKPGEPFLTIPIPADLPNEVALPAKPVSKLYLLTVGIDAYKGASLRGCVNDARLLLETFTQYSPSPIAHNRCLFDRQATKKNILSELEKLLRAAGPDDIVIFTFSGHGQNHSTRDKADQNTLVTYGAGSLVLGRSVNDPKQMAARTINETEFRELVQKAGQNDPHILMITDTHNGSANWLSATNPKHIVMAAGSDWETVLETYDNNDAKPHGAFTAALVAALGNTDHPVPQTYRSLIRKIYQTMWDKKYDQTPQLFGTEAALRRPFLSTDDSGILYATELTRYGLKQQSPAADEPLATTELQLSIDQLLKRYTGSIPPFSETSKNDVIRQMERAVTTADQSQGLSVVGIGGRGGLSLINEWKNVIQARVDLVSDSTQVDIADISTTLKDR